MKKLTVFYSPSSKAAQFVLNGINLDNVEVVPLRMRSSMVSKILFRLFHFLGLSKLALFYRYDRNTYLCITKYHENVLFWDCCQFFEYFHMKKTINCPKMSIFFWNPLYYRSDNKVKTGFYINKLKKYYNLCTFDPNDSLDYSITKVKNVNRRVNVTTDSIEFDFYFIGLPKSREEELKNINQLLTSKGFKVKIIIPRNKKEYISHIENIYNSAKCRCIIDFVSNKYKQVGMTLRPFDALFLKKKVLTNCQYIKEADFYNKNNIYIFSTVNDLDGIEEFMEIPYCDIPEEIIQQYEINSWIKQFI